MYEIFKRVKAFPQLLSNLLYTVNEICMLEGMQCAVQTRGPLNIYFFKWRAATGMQYILDDKIPSLF